MIAVRRRRFGGRKLPWKGSYKIYQESISKPPKYYKNYLPSTSTSKTKFTSI